MVNDGYLNYVDYAGMHPYGNSVAQVLDRVERAAKVYAGKPMILSEWNVRGATSQSTFYAPRVRHPSAYRGAGGPPLDLGSGAARSDTWLLAGHDTA